MLIGLRYNAYNMKRMLVLFHALSAACTLSRPRYCRIQ